MTWAVDLNNGGAALLIALMAEREQRLHYIPGRVVHHAAGGYRGGDSKTDAKDAAIIADQARMRRDLHPMRAGDEISIELGILTSRRTDLMRDRTRTINRLRALLGTYFPARAGVGHQQRQSDVDLALGLSDAGRDPQARPGTVAGMAAET